jgi:hypothetical protein
MNYKPLKIEYFHNGSFSWLCYFNIEDCLYKIVLYHNGRCTIHFAKNNAPNWTMFYQGNNFLTLNQAVKMINLQAFL